MSQPRTKKPAAAPECLTSVQFELLAPAGDMVCAIAAVENGADAVYFGLDRGFNARARATNISLETLPDLIRLLHGRGVRGYLTLNTLVFSDELSQFEDTVRAVTKAGVDAVLIQDLGVARLIKTVCPQMELHASTQMTLTSAECLEVAKTLGLERAVLARELSIDEIHTVHQHSDVPLEAFAHGALCVAYSGQCMTSESLGGRSANRGQCAQACRLPYELVCDGQEVDLGDQRYLLSPQDLAAHALLPEMLAAGVRSFKIEGRLKTPEYVANVTQKYRRALDNAISDWLAAHTPGARCPSLPSAAPLNATDIEEMELSFSRGFSSGWLEGCDHKMLVPALSSAKRGVYLGEVKRVRSQSIVVTLQSRVQPGDGVAFTNNDASNDHSQGGSVYEVRTTNDPNQVELRFAHGKLDFTALTPGMQVWKTADPQLSRRLRRTFETSSPRFQLILDCEVKAHVGQPLEVRGRVRRPWGRCLANTRVTSEAGLEEARKHPLTSEVVGAQLGRLGGTRFRLGELHLDMRGGPMAPLSILNQLRQQLVMQLQEQLETIPAREMASEPVLPQLRGELQQTAATSPPKPPQLRVLCRSVQQLEATVQAVDVFDHPPALLVEFQDIRRYAEVPAIAAGHPWWIATPRIQKPDEMGIFRALAKHSATGYLVRNLAGLQFFREQQRRIAGDFSLNVANELTAAWLIEQGLESVTISYDLNREQLGALLQHCPAQWLEAVIHQHMPMFHMEHCVFCAVLSPGTDKTNCGRPCDIHQVGMRDRVGKVHRLTADVGCRNTLYNATPQSAAEATPQLLKQGVRKFRIELLDDAPVEQVRQTFRLYNDLLAGRLSGRDVWTRLQAENRVGVTRGTMEERRNPLAIL